MNLDHISKLLKNYWTDFHEKMCILVLHQISRSSLCLDEFQTLINTKTIDFKQFSLLVGLSPIVKVFGEFLSLFTPISWILIDFKYA